MPRTVNTAPKPATYARACLTASQREGVAPGAAPATAMAVNCPRYAGTSGSTQGDRKLMTPAARATRIVRFVPSIGGISHHWTENTSDEDIVLGAQVFTDAIVNALEA